MSRARIDQPLDRQPQPTLKVAPPAHVRIQGGLTEANVDYTDVRAKGSLEVAGTLSVGGATKFGDVTIAGTLGVDGNVTFDKNLDSNGYIHTTDTTPSVSASDGALVVAGGAGIGGDLNVGDECSIGTDLLVNGSAEVVAGFQSNSTATLMAELAHTGSTAGFFGATPASQPAAIADATGAGDVVAQLNLLLAAMRTLGLIAT